jgi:FkbM family methyltransferase
MAELRLNQFKRRVRSLIGPRLYHILRSARHWIWSGYELIVLSRYRVSVPKLALGNNARDFHSCICPEGLSPASVIYSFGIGDDLSFEQDLIDRFGLTVHAFDPTPQSLAWVRLQNLPQNLVVHEFGVADYDGVAQFAPPPKDWVSFSMARTLPRAGFIDAPVRRLSTIMADLGHSHLDLLKMDIEGAEYRAVPDVLSSGIRPAQIMVEFHHRISGIGHRKTRGAIRLLVQAGYRVIDVSPDGNEITFVYRKPAQPRPT